MALYEKINLHSHTSRCRHAQGTAEDYAKEALRCKAELLGISDHTPFPEKRDEGVRMELEEFPSYVAEIEKTAQKYPQIRILKGLECDYTPEYIGFYRELKEKYHLDYLMGSVHFFYENGRTLSVFDEPLDHGRMRKYTEQMLGNLDTDLFSFIAHPDLFCIRLERWDAYTEDCVREMCRLAEQKRRPLEINMNGRRRAGKPYPNEKFWKIAGEYDIETLVNSDAHTVKDLFAEKEYGYDLQKKYHLREWQPVFFTDRARASLFATPSSLLYLRNPNWKNQWTDPRKCLP